MMVAAGLAAIVAVLAAVWLLWRADGAYEHAMLHETDAKTNPDRIAAVATDLIGALKSTKRAYHFALAAAAVLIVGTGLVLVMMLAWA